MTFRRRTMGVLLLGAAVVAGGFLLWRFFQDPYRLPGADWRLYQKLFISDQGRVIDTGNDNITHSEGQGYALLLAVAYQDRGAFDRIWQWTREHLQTRPDDRLLSWQWKPDGEGGGAVSDPNNASDGDLLVAWALVRASRQWKDFQYQKEAMQILVDLQRLDIVEIDGRMVLLPGTEGFRDGEHVTVNPSYYVFPALAELADAFPGSPWGELEKAGYEMLLKARFGEWMLAPDWIEQEGETLSLATKFPPLFGYNAVRVPLHLAWRNPRSELMQPFARFWEKHAGEAMPATVNLETGAFGPHPALPGMRAIAQFTMAMAENQNLTVRSFPDLNREESYFSASLNLLTKVAVRESFSPQ